MDNAADYPAATPESVWAAFREADKQRKEAEARFDREMAKRSAEFDKRSAEWDKQTVEWNKRMKDLNDSIGGITRSNGLFAEEYFFNSFDEGKQTFLGEKFEDIERNLKGIEPGFKDEYDVVLFNGKSIGIVEVKYKGRFDDIPKVIHKATTFRVNYPKYQHHKIYLAFASMVFNQRLEDECTKNGIAMVKQVGDTVVVNDAHLRAY